MMCNSAILIFLLPLFLPQFAIITAECKVLDRCELALELRNRAHVKDTQEIATWVCIAHHQSSLNTAAVGAGGYYGLYQIGAEFWCDEWVGANKACGMSCSKLQDEDIYDDYQCMRVIYAEHQRISGNGYTAWTSYQRECSDGRAINYIDGCFDNYIVSHTTIEKDDERHKSNRQQVAPVYPRKQQSQHQVDSRLSPATAAKWSVERSKSRARIYDRCELAEELVYQHSIPMDQVAMWVCIAQHESNYNTSAIGQLNSDGSGDHGLFQISDIYWCSPPGKGWACGLSCDKLEDEDITDDVKCMQKIYKEHQRLSGDGFNAWTVYSLHCKDRAEKYIDGCFVNDDQENEVFPTPGIIAPYPSYSLNVDTPRNEIGPATKPGRVYDRCGLARELVNKHSIALEKVATWVCIAQHESNFNTSAIGRLNNDGSADHGLFQISDIYWCSETRMGGVCGLSCAQLEDDDITDDVQCMKKIYAEHERISGDGFNAWTVYGSYCAGDKSDYIRGCFNDLPQTSTHKPGIMQSEKPAQYIPDQIHSSEKVFTACELAHELMNDHKVAREDVATWVCIAQHESNFNTSAIGRLNADGSEDHGLFQISDLYWCDDKPLGCGVSCSQLRDSNIKDDVKCVKKIYKEHQRLSGDGYNAWTVYNLFCKGRSEPYVSGCGLRGSGISAFEGALKTRNTTNSITIDKYPFFFSQFNQKKQELIVNQIERTTKKAYVWNTEPTTTRRPFEFRFKTTTTAKPTFTYPTRSDSTTKKQEFLSKRPWIQYNPITTTTTTTVKPTFTHPTRLATTTKKQEFLSKRPWIQYNPKTTTTTTTARPTFTYPTRTSTTPKKQEFLSKRPWIQYNPTPTTTKAPKSFDSEKDKIDFSLFDFFLKGSQYSGQSTSKEPFIFTTTPSPRTTTKSIYTNYNFFTKPSEKPREIVRPKFTAPTITTTTTRGPISEKKDSEVSAFNIFDLYLQKTTERNVVFKQNQEAIKEKPTHKPHTHNQFIFPRQVPVETSTSRSTTFDPFSVYNIDRNAYNRRTTVNLFDNFKWSTPPTTTRRTTRFISRR